VRQLAAALGILKSGSKLPHSEGALWAQNKHRSLMLVRALPSFETVSKAPTHMGAIHRAGHRLHCPGNVALSDEDY